MELLPDPELEECKRLPTTGPPHLCGSADNSVMAGNSIVSIRPLLAGFRDGQYQVPKSSRGHRSIFQGFAGVGGFRSPADGAIGRLALPHQAPHRRKCGRFHLSTARQPENTPADGHSTRCAGHTAVVKCMPSARPVHASRGRLFGILLNRRRRGKYLNAAEATRGENGCAW
jgi:hypothetical protein